MVSTAEDVITMSAEVEVNGLEQHDSKKLDAEAVEENGLTDGNEATEAEANGNDTTEAEPEVSKKLYFVRIPRPPVDDSILKRLQDEFQAHVGKIKALNSKLGSKRDECRELRKQLGEARSVKNESQPEFEEKLKLLKDLRDLKNSYESKLNDIRSNLKGLDCKSEEELDGKIRELEDMIRSGTVPLREEKQIVNQISKLNAQRDRIRGVSNYETTLNELKNERAKVVAVIQEVEKEFSIVKGERDEVTKVTGGIYGKLQAAEKELKELDEEQSEAVQKKNEVLETLQKTREEFDKSMEDYRANRKFSLQIRDLVATGQVEEARSLCEQQVDQWVSKLNSDVPYRKEYNKLWSSQRQYVVSDLLPNSGAVDPSKAAKAASNGADKSATKAPPVARGAEKAKAIIAAALANASREYAAKQRAAPPPEDSDEDDVPVPVRPAPTPAPTPAPVQVSKPASQASNVFQKVEVPNVDELVAEFVPPVLKAESSDDSENKEKLREEQKRKAQEAEQKKKRRVEQAERKRVQALEMQKKLEQERKEREKQAREAAITSRAAPQQESTAEESAVEAAATTAAAEIPAASQPTTFKALPKKVQVPTMAAAKRPKDSGTLVRKAKRFYQQNPTTIALAILAVIILAIIVLFARS